MKSVRASQMANGKIGTKAWGEFAPRNEWMGSGEHVVSGSEKDGRIQELGSFAELFEESLKSVEQGKVIEGEIVLIEQDHVLVDIGFKSEGQVPIQEFLDAEGNLTARVGDRIEVILEERENEQGAIFLSREKAANIKIWERIKTVHESNGTIQGTITSQLKGGFCVDIGVRAFLPGSQVDLRPVQDPKSLIGTKHDFKILKYDKKSSNVVLSRRAILEEKRASLRKATLSKLEDGMVLQGTVKNIADYGLFIDLGGIDGLVHRTDMSWGRVGHPSEMHQIGERIEVKVLHFDREKARVSLGIKQLSPDPWSKVKEAYPIGTRIKGRVVSMNDYGAFAELEPGVEGLIHISEMSWTRRVRDPSQILKVGDTVDVAVLNTDVAKKHIALSLKQATPNPWDIIEKKYPVGSIINGKIKSIADFGVFVPIREGIDGLVHLSDISWTRRIKHPSELYRENQDVKAVVLKIDRENERFSLGIKQLAPNPWDKVPEKYKAGTRVTGTVTNVTDFGVFVELEEGIEGLLHVSEMGSNGFRNPTSQYQIGDMILVRVIKVSREPKKIGLSLQTL